MIAFKKREDADVAWQNSFLAMLPDLERRLYRVFCYFAPELREECICEAVAHSLVAYVRLHQRGRAHRATALTLARYSSRQVKCGRPAAGGMNSKEPLSRYAQLRNRIHIEQSQSEWIETMLEDKRAPIIDLVAAKMDVRAWFATLSDRMRAIAKDLAFGFTTSEVAEKYGLTAGRISQLRRVLAESWAAFEGTTATSL